MTYPIQISVLLPAYNERDNLAHLLEELFSILEKSGSSFEVILVDDGSTDGTIEIAEDYIRKRSQFRYVELRRNLGKAAALYAGIRRSRGRIIVTLDADGQDDPAEIPQIVTLVEKSADLVVGWKKDRRDPFHRLLSSKIFNFFTNICLGTKLHDQNCGLKAGWREVFEAVPIHGELYRFIPGLAHSRGFSVTEKPVNHRPRRHGKSHYGLSRHFRGAMDLLTAMTLARYSRRPLHLIGGIGFLSAIIGGGAIFYLTLLWLNGVRPIGNRPLLAIGIMLFIVGVQFIVMGLLGELIASQSKGTNDDFHIRRTLGFERKAD